MEDVFPLKRAGVSGAELLSLGEDTLVALTGIARHRAHRIKRLQVGRLSGCLCLCVNTSRCMYVPGVCASTPHMCLARVLSAWAL
jgi:hypothetical protein